MAGTDALAFALRQLEELQQRVFDLEKLCAELVGDLGDRMQKIELVQMKITAQIADLFPDETPTPPAGMPIVICSRCSKPLRATETTTRVGHELLCVECYKKHRNGK